MKNTNAYVVTLPAAPANDSRTNVAQIQMPRKAEKRLVSVYRVYGAMTDTAAAVCRAKAPRFVYTALNTIYQRSAQPYIFQLMNDTIRIAKSAHYSGIDNYLDTIHADMFDAVQTETEKEHNYRMVTDKEGKRHRLAIIPETTLELTEYGRDTISVDYAAAANIDAEDLIQVALCELCRLAEDGIITDFDSVENCAVYVYRAVNKYVLSERRAAAKMDESFDKLLTVYNNDESGELSERILYGRNAQSVLDSVDNAAAVDAIAAYIAKHSGKADKNGIMTTVKMLSVHHTQEAIAKRLSVDVRTVKRYTAKIKAIRETAAFRAFVADMFK